MTIDSMLQWVRPDRGYALPSILFLITILSLVAAGVISLVFVQHQQALREVAHIKAEYAAQSGIAVELAEYTASGIPTRKGKQNHTFEDGNEATVEIMPWGLYQLVRSDGKSGRSHSTRIALAALLPPHPFQQALVFGNASHQLVFTGTSSVTGNVIVGQGGVTTGSLRNSRTPPRIPITGTMTKEASPIIPQFQTDQLRAELLTCYSLLDESSPVGLALSSGADGTLQLDVVSDSVESVRIRGDATIVGTIVRRERPLRIAIDGRATLGSGASLRGLVCLYASNEIYVSKGATIEHVILASKKRIELKSGAVVLGHVISPLIEIDSGAVARYPSIVLSFPVDSVGVLQTIQIHSGAKVEGLVALAGMHPSSPQESIVEIEPRAVVIGASYSENRTTLDGTVIGSVFTKDFYFYEAPTQYLGWIRNGVIDRTALPSGFLVPIQFSAETRMTVLDWL